MCLAYRLWFSFSLRISISSYLAQRLFFAACRVAGMALDYVNFSCILLAEWWWVWAWVGQVALGLPECNSTWFGVNSFKW